MGLLEKAEKKMKGNLPEDKEEKSGSVMLNPKDRYPKDKSSATDGSSSDKEGLGKANKKQELGEEESKLDENGRYKIYPTGIEELDKMLNGGLKDRSVVMVGGGAGSGKSIFSMQFLIEGIKKLGQSGLYVSFEETESRILKDMKEFWDIKRYTQEKKLVILSYTPEQVDNLLSKGGGMIRDIIEDSNIKRVVIDSLTALTLLKERESEKRSTLLELVNNLNGWGVTVFLISEQEPDLDKHISSTMEFIVDGVILLYNIRKGDIRERNIEIFKMRGISHSQKIVPFKIMKNKGLMIYPDETVF